MSPAIFLGVPQCAALDTRVVEAAPAREAATAQSSALFAPPSTTTCLPLTLSAEVNWVECTTWVEEVPSRGMSGMKGVEYSPVHTTA
jgi:hypothetical protein